MWNSFLEFLKAPRFADDEEKTRRARVLNALQLNMLVAIILLGGLGTSFFFSEKIFTSILLAVGVFATIAGMVLNRRGYIQASGLVMLVFLWLVTIFAMGISGGMQSLDIIFFISGTVMAGIILGRQGAIYYAIISLITGLAFITIAGMGFEFPRLFGFPPLGVWILLLINLAFTVIPLQVTLDSLKEAVIRSSENEEKYRLITSVMSDYAFSIQYGPDGEILNQWMGGAFEAITGYGSEELYARGGWVSLVHPEDRERDAKDTAQLHSNRSAISEVRIIRKDGQVRWVRSYAQPKWDKEHNQLAGIYGAVQDITEHKWVDSELRQRAEEVMLLYRLGTALTSGQNLYQALRAFVSELKGIMIVDAFHIGLYDAETDLFSYSLFLNMDEDLLPPPRKLGERPGLSWEVISTGKTLYLPDINDPATQRAHNIVMVVEAPIRSYIGIPLTLQDRVIGLMSVQSTQPRAYTQSQIRLLETLAVQVAITIEKLRLLDQVQQELADRKRAEGELQEREAILAVVAEAANTFLKISEWSESAWHLEVDKLLEQLGSTIKASHAYIFENHLAEDGSIRMSMKYEWAAPGIPSDIDDPKYKNMSMEDNYLESWNDSVLRGLPFIGDENHLSPQDMNNLRERRIQALLDVPIFINEKWWGTIGFDDMSHSRIWSAAEAGALVVAGNLVGAAAQRRQLDLILQDELNQRKTLIEELEVKNAELERFTYTVSHDLRSPLVTIQGFLGYLEKSAKDGNMTNFRKDLERISRATIRMDSLLRDVLELSRIGRVLNKPQYVPFEDLVRDALEAIRGRLDQHNITLQMEPPLRTQPDLFIIHGDKPRLTEVLQNLIDNAAKYMGDQKEPLIQVGVHGEENGKPIFYVKDNGMGIAPEYQERIFGLFDKLDAKSEGTGIGLALVRRIIEFHGCRIWVESEAGKGSTFYFTLPRK